MMSAAQILDSRLYWSLPGPSGFVHRIAQAMHLSRALIVNTPTVTLPGVEHMIEEGVQQAMLRPVVITVRETTDIGTAVARHVAREFVLAAQLADVHLPEGIAILLLAADHVARGRCEQYAAEFVEAARHCSGNVVLVAGVSYEGLPEDKRVDRVQIITFDGGLTYDEMQAYVGIQMIGRPGPGSTSLLRALVGEFAGFDVTFAHKLAGLDPANIIGIRDHLSTMAAESLGRWRYGSWLGGSRSYKTAEVHTLHDAYLAEHGSAAQRSEGKARINRRYWRACLKAITPWLEERRLPVVSTFFDRMGGPRVEVRRGSKVLEVHLEELEFNDIIGLSVCGRLTPRTDREREAYRVCSSAKSVRDELAHLRSPDPAMINELIHRMDDLVRL
jgi:hypothetical protein